MTEAARRLAPALFGASLLAFGACAHGVEVPPERQTEIPLDAGDPGARPEDGGQDAGEEEDAGVSGDDALDASDEPDGGMTPSLDASPSDGAADADVASGDAAAADDAGPVDAAPRDAAEDAAVAMPCPGCTLKVQWNTSTTAASSQSISGYLKLVNLGSAPISLSGVTVRYWLRDAQAESLVVECYYWDDGTGGNKCQRASDAGVNVYRDMTARIGMRADGVRYVELSFPASAGDLATGGTAPGAMQLALHLPSYAAMDQSDDPSFAPALSGTDTSVLFDAPKISAYVRGELSWGAEP